MNVARTTYRTALVVAALSCIGYAQLAHADRDDGDRGRWTEGRGENGRGYYAPDRGGRWDGDRGRHGGPPAYRPPGHGGWHPAWGPAPSWYYSRPYAPRYYGPPPPRWRPYPPPPPPVYYAPYPRGYWPGSYYGPSYAYPPRGDVSLTIRLPL